MFGQPTTQDTTQATGGTGLPPLDPSVMNDPAAATLPTDPITAPAADQGAVEHTMTPAYDETAVAAEPIAEQQTGAIQADPSPMAPVLDATAPLPSSTTIPTGDDDLLSIKQDAMTALSPLVGQLSQSPEEKFKTTMMMIQASDDKSLVRVAYEAAQAIEDEKLKAQALLDVVNEINYFLSHTN